MKDCVKCLMLISCNSHLAIMEDVSVVTIAGPFAKCADLYSLIFNKLRNVPPKAPTLLATAAQSGHSFIHNLKTKKLIHQVFHGSIVYGILLLDFERVLTAGTDNLIKMWQIKKKGKHIKCYKGHTKSVIFLLRIDDDHFASCSSDTTIIIWSIDGERTPVKILKGHTDNVYIMCKVRERIIASGSEDKTVRIWNVASGQCLHTLPGHNGNICCLTTIDSNTIACGGSDNKVTIYDLKSVQTRIVINQEAWVGFVLMMKEDLFIVSDNAHRLRVWALEKPNPVMIKQINTFKIDVMYKLNDEEIIVGGEKGVAVLNWKTEEYTQRFTMNKDFVRRLSLL
jgi:WD40 repeat protein